MKRQRGCFTSIIFFPIDMFFLMMKCVLYIFYIIFYIIFKTLVWLFGIVLFFPVMFFSIFHCSSSIDNSKSGLQYETYICTKLKSHGFHSIKTTPVTGDHGIDILAVRNNTKYAIQCKHYSTPVGNKAVQEAYTGCKYYGCDIPVVVSNNTFTKNALEEAKAVGVQLWSNNSIPVDFSYSTSKIPLLLLLLIYFCLLINCKSLYQTLGVFPFIFPLVLVLLYLISKRIIPDTDANEENAETNFEDNNFSHTISNSVSKQSLKNDTEKLEAFMRECNAYLEHQDEMEKYKDY